VHVAECLMEPAGIGRRGRLSLQIIEPGHLLSGCAGNKGLCEQLPKGRVVLAPSFANECRHGFVSVDLVLIAAPAPALGVSAIENEMRYALGMADGIGDRHGAAL